MANKSKQSLTYSLNIYKLTKIKQGLHLYTVHNTLKYYTEGTS